jgi:hypothetical protein
MRSAPSRRMVSPLSMVFSQMCLTSAANSAGLAEARGKWNAFAERVLHLGRERSHHGRGEDSGRDGDDANAEARQLARDGQRERDDSAF